MATTIQTILNWCSRTSVSQSKFKTGVPVWEALLAVGAFGCVMAVVAAVIILMISAFQLDLGPQSRADASLSSVSPRPPAVFAFTIIGLGAITAISVWIQFAMANGSRAVLTWRAWEREQSAYKRLQEIHHLGI